jgi:hypothetical protein
VLKFGAEPGAPGRAAAGVGEGDASQADGVEDAGFHVGGTVGGKTDVAFGHATVFRRGVEEYAVQRGSTATTPPGGNRKLVRNKRAIWNRRTGPCM